MNDWRLDAIRAERRTWRALDRKLDSLADFIAEHPDVWIVGDGEGGAVFMHLVDRLVDRGFDPPRWHWTTRKAAE